MISVQIAIKTTSDNWNFAQPGKSGPEVWATVMDIMGKVWIGSYRNVTGHYQTFK